VGEAVGLPAGSVNVPVHYAGPSEQDDDGPVFRQCSFDLADLIIGGTNQRTCFLDLIKTANRRVIIHSTFLDAAKFQEVLDPIRAACRRGIRFDLLWGAESKGEEENKNTKAAMEIARLVRQDSDTNGRFQVHMRTTGSHAKLMLLDTEDGWVAAVGSCNWLSSPFQSVELSVVLRDNLIVADVAAALQHLVGRRGLADNVATEMALTARDLRRVDSVGGPARIGVVVGEAHDRMIRTASGFAKERFFVGSNRLGSTARPGALMQGEVAGIRKGVAATVLYTQASGPLKNRHARLLAAEAAQNGVRLIRTRKIPLHGKLVAWDDDDLVITSLNWASAAADPDFPWGDIGVHISMPGVAAVAMTKLLEIFPELAGDSELGMPAVSVEV
jgi:cardiolipin synthase